MASRTRLAHVLVLALALALALATHACGPGSVATDASTTPDTTAPAPDAPIEDAVASEASTDGGLVGARPYLSRAPSNYDASRAWPLVVMLHGYGFAGASQDVYLRLSGRVTARGFLYAYPDGTMDTTGKRFWNATTACCDFAQTGVDDVAYLTAVIDDMSARYRVDPNRVFLIGHSNGGFMSHRFACDRANRVAAIVSLAGAGAVVAANCAPSAPVSVLEVHGDADQTVIYTGGAFVAGAANAYPSATTTVADWAARDGCAPTALTRGAMLDLDTGLAGAETRVTAYEGCRANAAVELWTIAGGAHVPMIDGTFADKALDWLFAHPRGA